MTHRDSEYQFVNSSNYFRHHCIPYSLSIDTGLFRLVINTHERVIIKSMTRFNFSTLCQISNSDRQKHLLCLWFVKNTYKTHTKHVLVKIQLRRNVVWKQGRRGWSHEEKWEGQELDNRMCCQHIKSDPRLLLDWYTLILCCTHTMFQKEP